MQTAKRFLNRYASMQAIREVKNKFLINGEVVMLLGLIIFMYVAMEPIM